MSRMRSALTIAAGALALTALPGHAAAESGGFPARVVRIPSHLTISARPSDLTFSGRVSSPQRPCLGDRRVTLYSFPRRALGTARTGPDGRWSIRVSGFAGVSLSTFYARVAARGDGTAGTTYVCRAARSRSVGLTGRHRRSV